MSASATPTAHDAVLALLADLGAVLAAPLSAIAEQLSAAIAPAVAHSALVIFTEDCTGRPQKRAGADEVIEHVTIAELDAIVPLVGTDGPWIGAAGVGGAVRLVVAAVAATGALLVLTDPVLPDGSLPRPVELIWELAAERIRQQVAEAPPAYLVESRAASAERIRVTGEMADRHGASLEAALAVLRSRDLDDRRARASAIEVAGAELVRLRSASDRVISMAEEPVHSAFERLRGDLAPLAASSDVEVQYVEPPAGGRALPGEVAHAARAIVRGTVLAIVEQAGVSRIRVHWDCDGDNLLMDVRDDGPGTLDPGSAAMRQLQQRVAALGGTLALSGVAGWGSDLTVALPLDPPPPASGNLAEWNLGEREHQVLLGILAGWRNRRIAENLDISENTVKFHAANVYRKLGASSRSEAAAITREAGLR